MSQTSSSANSFFRGLKGNLSVWSKRIQKCRNTENVKNRFNKIKGGILVEGNGNKTKTKMKSKRMIPKDFKQVVRKVGRCVSEKKPPEVLMLNVQTVGALTVYQVDAFFA